MVRTQIMLTPQQHKRLKLWARDRGISLSEAIRRFVDDGLNEEEARPTRAMLLRDALAVAGRYRDLSGATDVAINHDKYLTEAFKG